jgi:hypothetical protein
VTVCKQQMILATSNNLATRWSSEHSTDVPAHLPSASASPDYNLSPTCLPRIRTKEQPDALACVRGREMSRRVEVEGATVSSAGGSGLTPVGCTAVAAALPRAIGTPLWPSAKIAHMNAGAQHERFS